jgi:hypothetical protein
MFDVMDALEIRPQQYHQQQYHLMQQTSQLQSTDRADLVDLLYQVNVG